MEKIYMIPVNDAYSGTSECPFCALYNKAENDYLEYYLGPSLMEPDTRKITNKTGFCPEHMGKLNKSVTNRLGLGLVMHTHLLDFHKDISKDMINSAPSKAGLLKGRSSDYRSKLNDLADRIDKRVSMCPICEKLNDTMKHYTEVTAWMFVHNDDFNVWVVLGNDGLQRICNTRLRVISGYNNADQWICFFFLHCVFPSLENVRA